MQRAQMVVQSLDTCVFNQFSALDEDETIIKKCKQIYKAWNELLQAGGNKHPEQYIGGEPNTIEECMAIVSIKAPQVAGAIMQRQQQSQGMGENPALQEMGNTPEGSNGGIGGGAGAGINAPGINIPQPA
jgi:radical SAM superfamily enzyme with C-terminal helix-hairpin-helix motif